MNDETENENKAPDGEQLVRETNSGEPGSACWACGEHHDGPCRRSPAEQYADAVEQQLRDSLEAEGVDVAELLKDNAPAELIERTQPCGLEAPHGRHSYAGRLVESEESWTDVWCPGVEAPAVEDLGTYADMFAAYLTAQKHWIGPAQQPLVFHIRKLCQKLDGDPNAAASFASAYLQAVSRLDRMRPGNAAAGVAGDPKGDGQRSIFDELD